MHKFSYGDKRVRYNKNHLYVELVDNLHDLTDYEKNLDKRNIPWSVFVVTDTITCKFALITHEGLYDD